MELMELPNVTKNSASQLRNLIDNVSSHLNAMKNIGSEADIMNSLIIYIVTNKLDVESQNKYEDAFDYNTFPKWNDMQAILAKRCQLQEVREGKNHKFGTNYSTSMQPNNNHKKKSDNSSRSSLVTTILSKCSYCSDPNHKIEKCVNFEKLSVLNRFQKAKQLSLCINCLRAGHTLKQCKSSMCRVCSKKHHTLLHRYETLKADSNEQSIAFQPSRQYSGHASCTQASTFSQTEPVLLATAIVQIKDSSGTYQLARVLLDSGSQLNFITQRMVQFLQLKTTSIHGEISGIGRTSSTVNQETMITIKSRLNNFATNITCWVLPSITNNHPEKHININNFDLPSNLELADPTYFKPQKIDLLIGAEIFLELLSVGQIKLNQTGPILQKTVLGWILSGRYKTCNTTNQLATSLSVNHQPNESDTKLNTLLEKFWEIESLESHHNKMNVEQQNCETLFNKTTCRTDGRLMVKLPFKASTDELGDSLSKTKTQFFWLERKLEKNLEIKKQYSEFLTEYLKLNHMEEIQWKEVPKKNYFIPHQYVLRPDSSSTKLRVVFNASCTTSTNVSLNDILSVGPTVQNDIFSILFKFRWFNYALTADVSKMYRQIWVYPKDRNYQLILWRNNQNENIKIFRLNTLTYGTASAPYLAIRCLNYLADQNSKIFPKAANIIKGSVYVDDLIAGADTIEELYLLQQQISSIFLSAKLVLRKWYSNESSILEQIPKEDLEKPLRLHDIDVIRTLGMIWDPQSDQFRFKYDSSQEIQSSKITKRTVLSDLARLFDPLGLINPITVVSKLFMQELWLLKLAWDESLPQQLHNRWVSFKSSFTELNSIKIPRFVLLSNPIITTEIHGFCDSSIKAYGACIYVRTINASKNIMVNLLCAKSKIASSKNSRTLPELELLGAELLAKTWEKIKPQLPKKINAIYFWTDSTIVLGWISSHASKWQTFVANQKRFINNLKLKFKNKSPISSKLSKEQPLSAEELNEAFSKIIYIIQQHDFATEIECLNKNRVVHQSSSIKALNPFIDKTDNLLRVGGRLRNANLPYSARCPILLPKNNIFINAYIIYLHFRNCHAGSQALMSIISQQFWIVNARNYIRKVLRKCVHCFRYRPKLLNQIMGDLPTDRINVGLAFSISGVDFCGPIYTSPTIRGHKIYKTYIAVFVCFLSKGVHLEVVTDLSSNAFIAALKRFISRRTMCKKLYCDNATNFVGARKNLAELRQQFLKQSVQSTITTWCAENSITFEHIPPRSPHFGGLWEAAVKSAKSLLYPTLQHAHLTYESLSTVCCQIEAVLNSRPITQLLTDPNDEKALPPAHFWNQAPIDIFIEPDQTNANMKYLSKWQKISAVQQHFWKRWSSEYISSLQKRSKWQDQSPNIVVGKLVLVHEDNLPPQKWLVGRIVHIVSGSDGKVRVADVKTKCGILRRSIHKLALLPIDED